MHVDEHLARIGYTGSREPTAETLRQLHRAHLYAVPFENLDIPLGQPIVLSLPLLYEKIVRQGRGGFCYELNGLFGWLLRTLGFEVEMLAARVFDGKRLGPAFDHMLLRVDLGQPWIADVGFGDSFVEPLPLNGDEHAQFGSVYRFEEDGAERILSRRRPEAAWERQYVFSLKPYALDAFSPTCHYQQTSPDSSFTQKSVCSRATPEGRITVANGRLIVTTGEGRQETGIADEAAYREVLRRHFGIMLDAEASVAALLP